MFENLIPILLAFIASLIVSALIVSTVRWHGRWSLDDVEGIQKFHKRPTPRIGGLAILMGHVIAFMTSTDVLLVSLLKPILVCAFIPFFFGFREDLTRSVRVFDRLLASIVGAGGVIWLTGLYLNRLDVPGIDWLLAWPILGVIFSMIAVAGFTNAINILDGFHGLASGVSVFILAFLATIALQVGDTDLADMAMILAACVLGFMVINYPFGKLFLGDAGAYFIGFLVAWIAILLPLRNPEVSPWASLLICAYPVWEAVYSMYRRLKGQNKSTQADDLHLHSLIKRRWVRRYFHRYPASLRNAAVAPLIWISTVFLGFLALFFWGNTMVLAGFFVLFAACYVAVYRVLWRLPEIGSVSGN